MGLLAMELMIRGKYTTYVWKERYLVFLFLHGKMQRYGSMVIVVQDLIHEMRISETFEILHKNGGNRQ